MRVIGSHDFYENKTEMNSAVLGSMLTIQIILIEQLISRDEDFRSKGKVTA